MLEKEIIAAIIGGSAVIIASAITAIISNSNAGIATAVVAGILTAIIIVAVIIYIRRRKYIEIKTNIIFMTEFDTLLNTAQKEIIVIGGPFTQIKAIQALILSKTNLKIRILALNIEKPEISDLFYKEHPNPDINKAKDLNHLRVYKKHDNITVNLYEYLPLAYFGAVDINDPKNGVILVGHRLSGVPENNYPNMKIDRIHPDLYEYYRNHIENLWKNSEELDKPEQVIDKWNV
jgi:hypothetical protein